MSQVLGTQNVKIGHVCHILDGQNRTFILSLVKLVWLGKPGSLHSTWFSHFKHYAKLLGWEILLLSDGFSWLMLPWSSEIEWLVISYDYVSSLKHLACFLRGKEEDLMSVHPGHDPPQHAYWDFNEFKNSKTESILMASRSVTGAAPPLTYSSEFRCCCELRVSSWPRKPAFYAAWPGGDPTNNHVK